MRKLSFIVAIFLWMTLQAERVQSATPTTSPAAALSAAPSPFTLLGWNDLGMHCISPRFAEMAILPPYNNVQAILIHRGGEEPSIVSSGFTVRYFLNNNQSVTGKTDFWSYCLALFGKTLKPGIGLTGNGLAGKMGHVGDGFTATGIPALPYNDGLVWNPFQTATLTATQNSTGKILGTQTIVVPVSDEMNCRRCHRTGGMAQKGITGAKTTEQYILMLHDKLHGTHLMRSRPVLCASCHSDNALGTVGVKGVPSLSYSMHTEHAKIPTQPTCYDCHPGARTQCNRSAIKGMGPVSGDPHCADCHGSLTTMAAKLRAGRQPWFQEPTCAQCHGAIYSTGKTLYRNARGHGNVPCIACHGSPHAWWPSTLAADNAQQQALQHNTRAIGYNACYVCHTDGRAGRMPPHVDD